MLWLDSGPRGLLSFSVFRASRKARGNNQGSLARPIYFSLSFKIQSALGMPTASKYRFRKTIIARSSVAEFITHCGYRRADNLKFSYPSQKMGAFLVALASNSDLNTMYCKMPFLEFF